MKPSRSLASMAAALSAALLIPQSSVRADTVNLQPIADTTLQEAFPSFNFGDGTTFTTGGRRQGGRTRALLRFDISGNVPAGATINAVTLTLRVTSTPSGGAGSLFDINRVLVSWTEGNGSDHGGSVGGANQATWSNRAGAGTPWTTAGGDFSPMVSASRSIAGNGSYAFSSTVNMVSDVQGWLNNPAENFGWLLRSQSESSPTTIRRFGSRDDLFNSPMLTIDFTPVPEPGPLVLLGLGGLLVGRAVRRRMVAGRG